MAIVVVEQRLDEALGLEGLSDALSRAAWCREIHGVRHVESFIGDDGASLVCVFEAPDAEAVRSVARRMGYRYERIWTARRVGEEPKRKPPGA